MDSAMVTKCHLHFLLLVNKQQTSYEDVFRHPVSEAAKLGGNVFPTFVYAHFETAIHNAVIKVWSGCEYKPCRFYLGHTWWRKTQSLELSKPYGKNDSEVSQFLKKIFGLFFYHRRKSVTDLRWTSCPIFPNDKRVEQFCDYPLENYIDADPTFSPPVWSHCSASSLRTINARDSPHAHFNTLFYIAHPNILVIVSALQKIQNESYIKMRSVTTRKLKKATTIKKLRCHLPLL
jgi:hypothetical protein